ncbi:MAG: hypothetical protein Q9159_007459 [Coniocarpon cinnabarinum]
MSFNYDRYDTRSYRRTFESSSRSRSAFGYWVPLIITVTAATAALGAWVWRERAEGEEEDEYVYEQYEKDDTEYDEERVEEERRRYREEHGSSGVRPEDPAVSGAEAGFAAGTAGGYYAAQSGEDGATSDAARTAAENNEGFMAQMRGALGRTPSPQQLMSGAKSTLNAGIAAVGKGLNSIAEGSDEEHGDYFGDQGRWSEEAESRERTDDARRDIGGVGAAGAAAVTGATAGLSSRTNKAPAASKHGRTIALVVSAEGPSDDSTDAGTYNVEHASLLSHLIGHVSAQNMTLLILIYAPHLEKHPLASSQTPIKSRRTSTGSYDKLSDMPQASFESRGDGPISMEDADSEGQIINSYTSSSSPAMYNALATQAATLVSHPTHILPFTTPTGHVHMLKHLAPSLVYIQESLCGERGQLVRDIGGWVGQCVVVVGAEGAGLVDTETEDEGPRREEGKKWWQDERIVGLGKGVEVVEGMKLGEDWGKRVEGR